MWWGCGSVAPRGAAVREDKARASNLKEGNRWAGVHSISRWDWERGTADRWAPASPPAMDWASASAARFYPAVGWCGVVRFDKSLRGEPRLMD